MSGYPNRNNGAPHRNNGAGSRAFASAFAHVSWPLPGDHNRGQQLQQQQRYQPDPQQRLHQWEQQQQQQQWPQQLQQRQQWPQLWREPQHPNNWQQWQRQGTQGQGQGQAATAAAAAAANAANAAARRVAASDARRVAASDARRVAAAAAAARRVAQNSLEDDSEAIVKPTELMLYGVGNHYDASKTVVSRMMQMWPRWHNFCSSLGRPTHTTGQGLGLLKVNDSGTVSFDNLTIVAFVEWLDRSAKEDGGRSITFDRLDNGCQFLQTHLRTEARHYNDRDADAPGVVVTGVVNTQPTVKRIRDRVRKEQANRSIEDGVDLQAHLDNEITEQQLIDLMMTSFVSKDPKVCECTLLSRLVTGSSICVARATGQRGDDIRDVKYGMRFIRLRKKLGPNGTETNFRVTNKGKTNSVGRHTYTQMAPNKFPILSPDAWEGTLDILRFGLLKEPFPDFLDWHTYSTRPVYRSDFNHDKAIEGSRMSDLWRRFFNANDVVSDKLTHQLRRQGQQEMDDSGIDPSHISRFYGYTESEGNSGTTKHQKKSYLTNLPLPGVAERVFCEPSHPRMHNPAWASVVIVDELVNSAIPQLLPALKSLTKAYMETTSFKARKEERLFMGLGAVTCIYFNVCMAFRLLASVPVSIQTGKLDRTSEPLYKLFRLGGAEQALFFQQAVFDTPEWHNLVCRMREVQEQEEDNKVVVPVNLSNAFECGLHEHVVPFLREGQEFNTSMSRRIEHVEAGQASLLAGQARIEAGQARIEALLCSDGSLVNRQTAIAPATGAADLFEDHEDHRGAPQHQQGGLLPRRREDDKRADGTDRKRRRKVTRFVVTSLAREQGHGHRVIMSNDNKTLRQFWDEYAHGRGNTPALRDLEDHGNEWRKDVVYTGPSGEVLMCRALGQAWYQRVGLYNLVQYYIDAAGMLEEDAIIKGEELFKTANYSNKTHRYCVKDANRIFRLELKRLGGAKTHGR
jgi:hypothetical protein